jgi:pimeloyl-ACP methyl ester carboxylesterase
MRVPGSGFVAGPPRLHYLEWSNVARRALILLHGNSANAWWWRPVADAMLAADLRILALDLRGHGDSEWVKPPAYAPADYADDLARFIEKMHPESPVVGGHSMGGIAALAFATRYPKLARAVVAIDVPVTSSQRRNRYLRRLKALPTVLYPDLPTALERFRLMPEEGGIAPEILAEIAEKSLARTADGHYTMKFDRDSFFGRDGIDVPEAIRRITIPLLLVRAENSRIMTADAAAQAVRSNPLVHLVTIPTAHHHVLLECPGLLAHVIRDFISAL